MLTGTAPDAEVPGRSPCRVFASGRHPSPGGDRVGCGLEGLQSIVFGASSRGNIRQTQELIHGSWGR